jgi:hypothetical protein
MLVAMSATSDVVAAGEGDDRPDRRASLRLRPRRRQ